MVKREGPAVRIDNSEPSLNQYFGLTAPRLHRQFSVSQPQKGYISVNPWRDVKKTVLRVRMSKTGYAYNQKEIELISRALERITGREEYYVKVVGMIIMVCLNLQKP
jgi:hypothetical protein